MTFRTVPSLLAGLAVGLGQRIGAARAIVATAAASRERDGPQADGGDPCAYHEADDRGNETTAEVTGLSIGGGGVLICGAITARAPVSGLIDRDLYELDAGGAADLVVRLRAPDGRDVAELAINLTAGAGSLGQGRFVGNHAVFLSRVESGAVTLEIVAGDLEAPPAAIAYQVEVVAEDRAARCPNLSSNPTFTEVRDTTPNLNAGNDMVELTSSPATVAQTAATSDAPEASNLVVTDGMSYELAGTLAVNGNAAGYADDYLDRDTFLIATGAQTTELTVRTSWTEDGTTGNADDANLDVVLFRVPDGTAPPLELAAGRHGSASPPELEATAVLPSTTYWLWVGNYLGSAQPKPYELTICGVDFAP
jgi:hypothetical protein